MAVEPTTETFDAAAGDGAARFFDADYADYVEDLPALRAFARRTGGPLLELGCGTGRLAVPLAAGGYHVTGVDLSPGMLALARQRADAAGSRATSRLTLVEGDFATVPLAGPYRLAFVVMNTFLHLLTQEAQLQALRHWRAHLAPDAVLIIDVFFPDIDVLAALNGQVELDKTWTDEQTGGTVLKQVARTVDPAEQLMHVTFLYDLVPPGGRGPVERTVVSFDLRYLWRWEAELLLERAGFRVEAVYGSWELDPFDAGSERMIIVAGVGS
jgi:SAM-dependent methyltransferase